MNVNLLLLLILLPIVGCLFVALSRDDKVTKSFNPLYSAILPIITNIGLLLGLFNTVQKEQSIYWEMKWDIVPQVMIRFQADILSLLIIMGIQLSMLTGVISLRQKSRNRKAILLFSLLYLTALNGYFLSADVFSFYVCFALCVFPLLMQIGFGQIVSGVSEILRFFIFNMVSVLLFLGALVVLIMSDGMDMRIGSVFDVDLPETANILVLSGIFAALIMRLPIWPFYQGFKNRIKNIDNSLVFINLNLLPATGIYGLIRFWPGDVIKEVEWLIPVFAVLCVLTMFYAAVNSCQQSSLQEKLFDYVVIYYLLYLSGVFLPTDILQINIGYALFSFLLLLSLFSVAVFHIHHEENKFSSQTGGILCLLPRTSRIYIIIILAAVGLPITALFWNNFIILSKIYGYNFWGGNMVMISISMLAIALMNNLYYLKNRACLISDGTEVSDIDHIQLVSYWSIIGVLFLSFIKPLWFVL